MIVFLIISTYLIVGLFKAHEFIEFTRSKDGKEMNRISEVLGFAIVAVLWLPFDLAHLIIEG